MGIYINKLNPLGYSGHGTIRYDGTILLGESVSRASTSIYHESFIAKMLDFRDFLTQGIDDPKVHQDASHGKTGV